MSQSNPLVLFFVFFLFISIAWLCPPRDITLYFSTISNKNTLIKFKKKQETFTPWLEDRLHELISERGGRRKMISGKGALFSERGRELSGVCSAVLPNVLLPLLAAQPITLFIFPLP
jgi:hypothetical protein